MQIKFVVTVDVKRRSGPNVEREEIVEELLGIIEGADPQDLVLGDKDSEYETGFTVEEDTGKK